VPHRRLAALPLALLAAAGLAAGCAIEVQADSIPVPFSVAPTPSASAGVPKYVCTAAYKILTDGAVHLAAYVGGAGENAEKGMRDTFTGMAAQVTAEADRTTDAELEQALRAVADDLTAGAGQADPKAYVDGGFQTVGQKLDGACADA
jgi:hypothetical protein